MRLIDKLLGKENATQIESVARSGSDSLPRGSVFGGPRVLRTESDVRKDDALLNMSTVVAEIERNPDGNWAKYKGDFERAVTGMREAFEAQHTVVREVGSDSNKKQPEIGENLSEFPVGEKFQTKGGNAIERIWAEGWYGNDHYVSNEQVGRSAEGFHGGVSFSWKSGKRNIQTHWAGARGTFDEARETAKTMQLGRSKSMDKEVARIERSWDR